MKKVAIGQAGGPTAVINATLVGLVETVQDECEVLFVQNGYEGLVNEHFLTGDEATIQWVTSHRHVPGACLGSGRYAFTDEAITQAVTNLKKQGADTLFFIGGNGTMEALLKVKQEAIQQGMELTVIGLPKTVDNDLGSTDHAPGFGSAAHYVAQYVKDASRDLHAMKNFEQIRVLETMGRNAGWLAAASGVYKEHPEEGPHFIAVPEQKLDRKELLRVVKAAIRDYGYAVVVVSEGVKWEDGEQIERAVVHGRAVLGGISEEIEAFLKEELQLSVRSELLGMNQRAGSQEVSTQDQMEAYEVGRVGGEWAKEGADHIMVSFVREQMDDYEMKLKPVKLEDVIHEGERGLPSQFIENPESYYAWLRPLLGGGTPSYPPLSQRRVYNHEKIN
ncbi:hypothetical protein N781_16435 [Pontibacillus halophilus JSM 076056 = DSM 19796]|uniref:6-phosphofructokinase n=1 Tax=Pontibacillus halophilus JSM 076056 = DSM 19796 TaxID=1385510 RepID=A0A0A5GMQ9_9BACI|nr:diphosphate--fructose-6-phosphate 1-phosphotransferase [Pontibacillus halophilus]KGX92488.1 hypothetical protein N781_16435 [Pontibacillus halophilus JSM 076056 = DSM 19796]